MNVSIRKIVDNGTLESERVILDVANSEELGNYLLMDSTYQNDNEISNKIRHPYWFPNQKVKKGDVVLLYTKPGKNSSYKKNNHMVYVFYWNLKSCVWNNDGDCAVLMLISDWQTKGVN